jgi:phosphoglycolate phosphatase
VNELLEGRRPASPLADRSFRGDGVSFSSGASATEDEELARAEALYLSIYRRRLLETTRPYPGVVPALESLHREFRLAVLTNKPVMESVRILEGLDLRRYFQVVYGGDSFARKKPDPIGVRFLQEETGSDTDETLLVGDSTVDFSTARNAGIRSCLVRYGLGPWNQATEHPDLVVDDLRELASLVHSDEREL